MTKILSFALAFAAVATLAQGEERNPRAGGDVAVAPVESAAGPRAPRAGGEIRLLAVEIAATPEARRPRAGGETGIVVAVEPVVAETARMLRRPRSGGETGLEFVAAPEPVAEPRRPRAGGKGGGAPGYASTIADAERRPRAGGMTVQTAADIATDALVAGLEQPAN